MLLSVIIPVFNEEEIVAETYRVLEEELKDIEHELIFVNDGSKDRTREIVEGLLPGNPNNKIINFSRNFGHQAAFSAGLDHAQGAAVVIIDGDLQDPPSLIHEMLEKWREGYQVVYAQRNKRKGETLFKRFTAFCFYRLIGKLTSIDIPPDTGDFRLMDRCVVDQLKNLPERSRFLRGLVCWVGFKKIGVKYDRAEGSAQAQLLHGLHCNHRWLCASRLVDSRKVPLPCNNGSGLGIAHDRHRVLRRRAAFDHRHSRRIHRPNLRRSQAAPAVHRRQEVDERTPAIAGYR